MMLACGEKALKKQDLDDPLLYGHVGNIAAMSFATTCEHMDRPGVIRQQTAKGCKAGKTLTRRHHTV